MGSGPNGPNGQYVQRRVGRGTILEPGAALIQHLNTMDKTALAVELILGAARSLIVQLVSLH